VTRDELVGEIRDRLREGLLAAPQPFGEVVDVDRDVTGNVVLVRQAGLPAWAVIVVEVPQLHLIDVDAENEHVSAVPVEPV